MTSEEADRSRRSPPERPGDGRTVPGELLMLGLHFPKPQEERRFASQKGGEYTLTNTGWPLQDHFAKTEHKIPWS